MSKLKRAVITEELCSITKDIWEAVLLHQFLYWSTRTGDADRYVLEERNRDPETNIPLTRGWIYKTASEISDEIMASVSIETIRIRLNNLVDAEWLDRRKNPKHKWDRTYQYRPNMQKIEAALRENGYTLATILKEHYPRFGFCDTIPDTMESKPVKMEALPETTPEITPIPVEGVPSTVPGGETPFSGPWEEAAVITKQKVPVKKKRRRDPRLDHPAIRAVKEAKDTVRNPPKGTWDVLIKTIGDNPDVVRLKQCWTEWCLRGYNTASYKWVTDWYVGGIKGKMTKQENAGNWRLEW